LEETGQFGVAELVLNCAANVATVMNTGRAAAIQQRVTAVLLSIPKQAFADSFQKLYDRCQPVCCEG
jgi:methylmalonyl-CoA mutase cobalamin-binding subunit